MGQRPGLYARPPRPTVDGPGPDVHLHSLYVVAFIKSCGIIYVSGGSLTLRYKDKENLLINGCPRNGHGDARCTPARQGWAGAAATGVKVMEMQVGRRPVYGGAPHNRPRKGYGDPPRAPARQGWAGADRA